MNEATLEPLENVVNKALTDNKSWATQDFLTEYLELFPPNRSMWKCQESYTIGGRNPWGKFQTGLSDADILRHLDQDDRYWIATRCPVVDT